MLYHTRGACLRPLARGACNLLHECHLRRAAGLTAGDRSGRRSQEAPQQRHVVPRGLQSSLPVVPRRAGLPWHKSHMARSMAGGAAGGQPERENEFLTYKKLEARMAEWRAEREAAVPVADKQDDTDAPGPTEAMLLKGMDTFTQLFPLWCVVVALAAFYNPPLFTWFDTGMTTNGLMFIMLGMGITLTLEEITTVFTKQPQLLILGMVLQYSVLPAIGFAISRNWGLANGLAVGVALVSCMPGGTASNIMAYLAKGDIGLSVMMTTASTLAAIVVTPLLTLQLVGTLIAVDAQAMFLSVLQLVLAPVLIGATVNTYAPHLVKRVKAYMPFAATTMCVLIIGSMVATNADVVREAGFQILSAVTVLHSCGFALGYGVSKALGLPGKVARTNSIEVGMQSSALAGVLARLHFDDPTVVAPCVCSAVVMCTIGSMLAGYWSVTVKDDE